MLENNPPAHNAYECRDQCQTDGECVFWDYDGAVCRLRANNGGGAVSNNDPTMGFAGYKNCSLTGLGAGIEPGESLSSGFSLYSANHAYRLDMQAGDGNLVLYQTSDGAPLWNTGGQGAGAYWHFQASDGALILYSAAGQQLNATGPHEGAGWLTVQDNGPPRWIIGGASQYEMEGWQ